MKLQHIKVEHIWAVVFFTVFTGLNLRGVLHRRSADVGLLCLETSGGVSRYAAGQRRSRRLTVVDEAVFFVTSDIYSPRIFHARKEADSDASTEICMLSDRTPSRN